MNISYPVRYWIAALVSGALLLGLAACGGGDDSSSVSKGTDGGSDEETVFGAGRQSGVQSIDGDVVKIVTGLGAVVTAKKASDPSQYFVRAPGGGGLYSAEVEILIQDHLGLARTLAADQAIVDLTIDSNKVPKLSYSALKEQEAAWTENAGDNDFANEMLANKTSVMLKEFQAANPGVAEVILTNKRGLILATTNVTERFDQSRFTWWRKGYNEGRGDDFHDDILRNKNLDIQGVPVYVPILDPSKVRGEGETLSAAGITYRDRPLDQAVGVMEVFVSLDWMKEQLGVADAASTPATP